MSLSSGVRSRSLQSTRGGECDWDEDIDASSAHWIYLSSAGYVRGYLAGLCFAELHCDDCRGQIFSAEGGILSGAFGHLSHLRRVVLLFNRNHRPLTLSRLLCPDACHRKERHPRNTSLSFRAGDIYRVNLYQYQNPFYCRFCLFNQPDSNPCHFKGGFRFKGPPLDQRWKAPSRRKGEGSLR